MKLKKKLERDAFCGGGEGVGNPSLAGMAIPRRRRDPSSHSHPRVPFFVVVVVVPVALLLVLIHGGGFDRIGALEHGFEVLRREIAP